MKLRKNITLSVAVATLITGCVAPGDWINDPVSFRGTIISTNGIPIREARIIAVQPYSGIGRQHLRAAKGDFIPDSSPRTMNLKTDSRGDFDGEFSSYLRGGPVWIIPPISLIWPPQSYVLFGIPGNNRVFAVCYTKATPTTQGWIFSDGSFTRMDKRRLQSEFRAEKIVSTREDALNRERSETLHSLDIQIKE